MKLVQAQAQRRRRGRATRRPPESGRGTRPAAAGGGGRRAAASASRRRAGGPSSPWFELKLAASFANPPPPRVQRRAAESAEPGPRARCRWVALPPAGPAGWSGRRRRALPARTRERDPAAELGRARAPDSRPLAAPASIGKCPSAERRRDAPVTPPGWLPGSAAAALVLVAWHPWPPGPWPRPHNQSRRRSPPPPRRRQGLAGRPRCAGRSAR